MAEKLHLKIVGYDDNHNLLVSFATDDSKNTVHDYPVYSFQPHQFLDKTADEIIVEIAKMGLSTDGRTMYLTLSPCKDCAKLILQSGVKRVVYLDLFYRDNGSVEFLKQFIKVEKYEVQ